MEKLREKKKNSKNALIKIHFNSFFGMDDGVDFYHSLYNNFICFTQQKSTVVLNYKSQTFHIIIFSLMAFLGLTFLESI